jgi:hypothetical protein
MALFDAVAPTEQHFTPLAQATGSTRTWLSLLGYKQDGSQNTWGKLSSWLPGVGVGLNAAAKSASSGDNLKAVNGNIQDDTDNRMSKLMTQLGIVGTVAGIATGQPQLVQAGIGQTLKGGSSLLASGNGVDRSDDNLESEY